MSYEKVGDYNYTPPDSVMCNDVTEDDIFVFYPVSHFPD